MTAPICRNTMTPCLTPGMCSPHGGCRPEQSATTSTIATATPHETYEGLRRQFMALRTLAASNEAIASGLSRQLKDQSQTLADLDAERSTNAQLTEALEEAERERDELKEQVRVLNEEGRTLRLSGCDIREHDLIESVMRGISGSRRNTLQRWSLVRDTFCTGSGVATALCRRFGYDPDEILKS